VNVPSVPEFRLQAPKNLAPLSRDDTMVCVKRCLTVVLVFLACPSARGQLIQVHGHRLFLNCQGDAKGVTVILIAGAGGTTETWNKVQQPISAFSRVCSYDRLGIGQSDPLPKGEEQSVNEIVSDLESLLKAARIMPPYVLVGHSIGGLYARAFDKRFDPEVAGMVFIDSAHEEQIWRFAQSEPDALSEYPRWRDQRVMSAQGFLPPGEHLRWRFTKPLVVIEHAIPPEPVWHKMQQDLASRSTESCFITATRSSHYIQKLQPTLVVNATREVLTKATGLAGASSLCRDHDN
jgi:pimeloyl-ACP methyl ester carboxylesterase